jgi:hypothetical protein
MATMDKPNQILRVTLCEVERGLFHATYHGAADDSNCPASEADLLPLPIYQLANCVSDARAGIERSARAMGFDTIIWEGVLPAPNVAVADQERDHSPAKFAVSSR